VIGDGVSIVHWDVPESIVTNCGVVGEWIGEFRKLVCEEYELPRDIRVE